MTKRDSDIIVARFKRSLPNSELYIVEREKDDLENDIILKFYSDDQNFTLLTTEAIVGRLNGESFTISLELKKFSYEFVDRDGHQIKNKEFLNAADGVIINNQYRIWLPQNAVLAFCNILNFLSEE